MKTKLKVGLSLLVVGIIILIGGWFILSTQNDKFCTGNLEECVNQNITIGGNLATTTVYQHFLPSDIPPQYENIAYLDTKDGQIILLSKEEVSCENNIKIYGLLKKETIECGPGIVGKCPAEEYIVYIHEYECLNE